LLCRFHRDKIGTVTSERVQRRIERLLDQLEEVADRRDWDQVKLLADDILRLDPENQDAKAFLAAAGRDGDSHSAPEQPVGLSEEEPTSFAGGRYSVTRFLGEGGKKKVYLAHDAQLDRDVAFALIKTEGLDDAARVRITREAQAMGRLGSHPHIVTVYDIGEENGQPYLVLPVLPGGDVEGVIEDAPEHKLSIEQAVKIATETCLGLEFSHAKGIIHRDLKPGNVWLAEDGRAMIGDFGLAVAVDRSRLTQAGMMVGTVSYMPPEQAMGGEVTPRSDLYSLGAMLYEMVCGRPPFVGDESVAIIGQHLNTPPVAPTWHRPDCPPGLEALILRLLEKDASKRPSSASEVREALESVSTPSAAPTVHEEVASPHEHDPLYRRVFVGRETELRQLQQAFDAAMSGQGGLVMVVGEPGIGKTSIVEQLATYASMRGGNWLVGHCYEEGSLSLPYLAFVEAMRSYVMNRDPDALRSELGTGAADVARIVSEVRDRVHVDLRDASDPEDDRWRLLNAITTFLRNAAAVQPLVIVLEDLHWADRGTLDLLLHVARNLEGARLLVVGTYRDVEVDRSHPLSATLGELRRVGTFARIPLRGLTVDEVHRMYEEIRGQATPWGQAEAVHRQTEGNPLFVQEVLRYLVEEGIVIREGGRYVAQGGEGVGIPEGLRDVVGRRLSRLSEKTNQVLAIAAVMGREFRLDVLQRVAVLPEEEIYRALEEAVERAVVEERSGVGASVAYRFAHAFFRQTLYEETIAPRRIRLHQQVARALESVYGSRLEEHAAELAEHYSYSSTPEDLKKAVEYGELAAARATSVFDYGEAERHLSQALKVQEVLDPEDKLKRCDLLLALGEAMLPQENPARVADLASSEAFDLAESLNDPDRAARASLQAFESAVRSGRGSRPVLWAERADQHARLGTKERVYADIYLGLARLAESRETGHALLRRAVERSIELDDNSTFFAAAGWAMNNLYALRDRDLVAHLVGEVLARPRDGVRTRDLSTCFTSTAGWMFNSGRREEAESIWNELTHLTERTADATLVVQTLANPSFLAFVDGHLEEALSILDTLEERARERRVDAAFQGLGVFLNALHARVLHYLGQSSEQLLADLGTGRPGRLVRLSILGFLGRTPEASEIIRSFAGIESIEDESAWIILLGLIEASVLAGDKDTVLALLPRLAPYASDLSASVACSLGRPLGDAAKLLGRPEDARDYYRQATEACEKVRFRPELALTRAHLAELLLDHYPDEHDAAIEHLDFAIAEFRDMKMQPALERALGRRGLLKA
jgi:tetratricopeptide (TPR) repeat protein